MKLEKSKLLCNLHTRVRIPLESQIFKHFLKSANHSAPLQKATALPNHMHFFASTSRCFVKQLVSGSWGPRLDTAEAGWVLRFAEELYTRYINNEIIAFSWIIFLEKKRTSPRAVHSSRGLRIQSDDWFYRRRCICA